MITYIKMWEGTKKHADLSERMFESYLMLVDIDYRFIEDFSIIDLFKLKGLSSRLNEKGAGLSKFEAQYEDKEVDYVILDSKLSYH
ncbi:hypothetical protein Tco_0526503 [Tanacetum coccineum]